MHTLKDGSRGRLGLVKQAQALFFAPKLFKNNAMVVYEVY
jgi:hypothetical protein